MQPTTMTSTLRIAALAALLLVLPGCYGKRLTVLESRTARIEKTPAPFVLQTSLDDFYVSYKLHVHTKEPAVMHFTYGELHANIQDAFNRGGVEIMSPHYASLRDGNTITIPEGQRPKGYEAPRFGVRVDRAEDGSSRP